MSEKVMALTPPFVAVCVDSSNRPPEIPENKWVILGKQYTVNKVVPTMDGKIGFVIDELELGENTFPYDSINPRRFAIPMPSQEVDADKATSDLLDELKINKQA